MQIRQEKQIFDDLGELCTSPGYVHAIAYFCARDRFVLYEKEMTAADMRRLFTPTALLQTEISTLIGLLIKKDVDYTRPSPDILRQYTERTEALLEEMHQAIGEQMFDGLDLKEVVEKGLDPFSLGKALREPIFYNGESAYSFQYRDFAPRKYAADDSWLECNKGFTIKTARDVVRALTDIQNEKLGYAIEASLVLPPDERTILPGFSFTLHEASEASGLDQTLVEKVINAFTLGEGERNEKFRALHDFNSTNATPLLRTQDDRFILFQQYSLVASIYESPFYWMILDRKYADVAMEHRGRFAEEFSKERLELVFGKENVHSNVDIYEGKNRSGEIDVLVLFGDRAIVLQAKSKRLTLEARKGNDGQIKEDFQKSVQDSYDQAYDCAKQLSDRKVKLVDADHRAIAVPKELKEVYIFCVVSDHYPALSFQTRQFLKSETSETIRPPFVMDVFALDAMTEMLESPLRFLSYVNRRTMYHDKLLARDELTILSHHLKRNLWVDDKYDQVLLEDDIAVDLDVAMTVRRDHVPGKRTPDGILTRVSDTALGRILKEIEVQADPQTLDLGFLLLTLSEVAFLKISEAIDSMAIKARQDGNNHDVTVPLGEGGAGLTVHCNHEPISAAGPRLEAHCLLRKYIAKARNWYGVCVRPSDITLRFGIGLNYKWEPNTKMDVAARDFLKGRRPSNVSGLRREKKIGRNAPCPCGSGLKYKKCCLK